MNRIEYKEGIIWCGEEKASNQLSTLVACLSAQIGKTEKETCDLINQCMQSFDLLYGENKRPCREVKRYFRYSGIGYLRILRSQEDEARQQLYSGNRSYRKSKYQMA